MASDSAPRRKPLATFAKARKAGRARSRLVELVDAICAEACPRCGNDSLASEDGELAWGIVVYCQRHFCGWKPFNHLAEIERTTTKE